ncbi:MAG TPA: SDR family oxidoreductase [Pseudonocardiaceae bacterium]|jgi:nucleoside-diphosphate-sugar epimerase|nr:SDR family oxidoreductase [Pseudonocardiaceae bacterium]
MRVFVTGASGWIGSAVLDELLAAGHDVIGLARSDASAAAIEAKGARIRRGDLDDLDGIRAGAEDAEAVVHLASKQVSSDMAAMNAAERGAVQTIGEALTGTGQPFLVASALGFLVRGRPATEADPSPFHGPDSPRGGSENLALEFVARGVRVAGVRFAPTVHGAGNRGFIGRLAAIAREKGVSGYPGVGTNRWSAVHRSDAARLVALGLEKAPAGALLHAVAEEGVPTRKIAEALGRALGLPVTSIDPDDIDAHFGFMATFFGIDISATSIVTRELLGWTPTGPTLVEDIDAGVYSTP